MHIDLEKAYQDGGSFEARLPAATLEWEGGDPIETGPSLLKGRLTRVRRGFDLDADLASRLTLKCVRCLEFYSIELSFPFHLLFVSKDAEAGEGHDHQLQDADCDLYPCAGGKVDPSDLAREQLYLHVPLKPVCSEHCRGLCAVCGEDLNRGPCRCGQPAPVRVI